MVSVLRFEFIISVVFDMASTEYRTQTICQELQQGTGLEMHFSYVLTPELALAVAPPATVVYTQVLSEWCLYCLIWRGDAPCALYSQLASAVPSVPESALRR